MKALVYLGPRHVVSIDDSPKVFDMIADPDGTIKVLVDCAGV